MPPRKRAAAATAAPAASTKATAAKRSKAANGTAVAAATTAVVTATAASATVKTEPEPPASATTGKDSIINKLKAADRNDKRPKVYEVDKHVPGAASYNVYSDYACTLNQTNIGHNNNKFYIIQILQSGPYYYCWNRWGRVGEIGQNNGMCVGYTDPAKAIKEFEKKFYDKTRNKWEEREKFEAVDGKYTLIETESASEASVTQVTTVTADKAKSKPVQTLPCKLDATTQDLMNLIFSNDMFKETLATYNIDVKKMPLGKLTKTQIAKGFERLEEIEAALKGKAPKKTLLDLSSKFYTAIPHDFGRNIPPAIDTEELLQNKYDMLTVLSDIELAQSMQEENEKESAVKEETVKPPHPLDQNYQGLKCKLELVDKNSDEFKIIDTYTNKTKCQYHWGGGGGLELLNVWRVEREEEKTRFNLHNSIENRKLLWHGTKMAVVVAILKSGLRIMPHSGGRVGRGIYFASENGKSAGYVGTSRHNNKNIGIMFLNEVALGKEHHIMRDDGSLTQAPKGYDCIIAKGHTEPDPTCDTTLTLDGKKVIVPQGAPKATGISSSFSQSEYLIYKESQNRIRYMLQLKF